MSVEAKIVEIVRKDLKNVNLALFRMLKTIEVLLEMVQNLC